MTRLLKCCTWLSTGIVNAENPVRRFRRPWISCRTEFEFARVRVKPVNVFVNKLARKIATKPRPWDEL